MRRFAPALALASAALVVLSACSVDPSYVVSGSDLATTAEDALEAQVGARPSVDCGTDDIPLVKGTTVDCVLTDPATGDRYDAPVTIQSVDGANYTIGVSVADTPLS